jgi:hypothetical protein
MADGAIREQRKQLVGKVGGVSMWQDGTSKVLAAACVG